MKKIAFTMRLLPGQADEYERRHDVIWPELVNALKDAGVSDYSIFIQGQTLFAVLHLSDDNHFDILSKNLVVQRWWRYMSDIMETHPDHAPMTEDLRRVFHMD